MAKVTITIEDADEGKSLNFRFDFDPPIDENTKKEDITEAQFFGVQVAQMIEKVLGGEEE